MTELGTNVRRMVLSGVALLALAVTGSHAAASVTLVEAGQARAGIILAADAPGYARQAAELLQGYLLEISGAKLDIVHEPGQVRGVRIWIGEHPQQQELIRQEPRLGAPLTRTDEILMYAGGQDVVIRGRDRAHRGHEIEVGTFLATQRFITEQLGVRWLWPGELGTDVPRRSTVSLTPFFKRYAPQMTYRRIRGVEYEYRWKEKFELPGIDNPKAVIRQMDDEVRTWLNRHNVDARMGGRGDGVERPIIGGQSLTPATGHYFSHWYGQYFDKHPEWFALQPDGTRGTFPPNKRRVKLCVSNPEVLEQYVKEAISHFENSPQVNVIGISPNDHGWLGYCVCENCEAWDSPNAPQSEQPLGYADGLFIEHVAITDRKARFWNAAARRVREHFPDRDVRLLTYGYNAYRTPPVDVQLEDNIIVQFEGVLLRHRHQNSDESIAAHKQLWLDWAAQASHMVWRPNFRLSRPGDPYTAVRRYGQIMNFLADNRASGIDLDTTMVNHWSTQGPQYYLCAVMAWDPHASAEEIMADYYARAFGPAAEPMRAYYELFEHLYEYMANSFERWSPQRHIAALYRELRIPPNEPGDTEGYLSIPRSELEQAGGRPIETRAAAYLEEARRSVADADPIYRERIEFVAVGLDYTQAHLDLVESMQLLFRSPNDAELRARANEAYQRQERILLDNFTNYALNYIASRNYTVSEEHLVPPDFR